MSLKFRDLIYLYEDKYKPARYEERESGFEVIEEEGEFVPWVC